MNPVLRRWNEATASEAVEEVLPCNGARAWAAALAAGRPFPHESNLLAAADSVWRGLSLGEWDAAFNSHPRLGERRAKAATETSLAWSAQEQSCLRQDHEAEADLIDANRAYELRFSRTFLLCATGKSTAEVLAALQRRLRNDPAAELEEAAEQQRRITQLRLRRWLQLPAARCEDV